MELRREFVYLARWKGANVSALCRRFGISRATGYKWLERSASGAELVDRSRRPHHSPGRCSEAVEAAVLALRARHPSWGGRKLARRLRDLGYAGVPAPSTITAILRRYGRLDGPGAAQPRDWQRFEHPCPNALWQMDFKGHFALATGRRCHPLTVLDDHSRYALGLAGCHDERSSTVQDKLTATFRRYGLPECMLCDNGGPWGDSPEHPYTPLGVWLLRLGVGIRHSRPYHPQTLGKDERFHRSLNAEVLSGPPFADLTACQQAFDQWRHVYNHERPHEALGLDVPATRYRSSPRSFPEVLPALEFAPGCHLRKVEPGGRVNFQGRRLRVPKAFAGYHIGLRPTLTDGLWEAVFLRYRIAQIDLRDPAAQTVSHVPEQV
jgi:transposase InsO family protein